MSERKTTEIKLRVTPAEKVAWQCAAEEDGIGLSELVRREMNTRVQQKSTWAAHAVLANIRDIATNVVVTNDVVTTSPVSTFGETGRWSKPWMFEARERD